MLLKAQGTEKSKDRAAITHNGHIDLETLVLES